MYDYVCLKDPLRVNQFIYLILLYFRNEYFSRRFWHSLTCIGTQWNALAIGRAWNLAHIGILGTHWHSFALPIIPWHSLVIHGIPIICLLSCILTQCSLGLPQNSPTLPSYHILACLGTQHALESMECTIMCCHSLALHYALEFTKTPLHILAHLGTLQQSLVWPSISRHTLTLHGTPYHAQHSALGLVELVFTMLGFTFAYHFGELHGLLPYEEQFPSTILLSQSWIKCTMILMDSLK